MRHPLAIGFVVSPNELLGLFLGVPEAMQDIKGVVLANTFISSDQRRETQKRRQDESDKYDARVKRVRWR